MRADDGFFTILRISGARAASATCCDAARNLREFAYMEPPPACIPSRFLGKI